MNQDSNSNLEKIIYSFRGYKVMVDSDLAVLYGVETKVLNQAVKRNIKRFPEDFMFQLTSEEAYQLGHKKYPPFVFTENGVAMLSGILSFLVMEQANSHRIDELQKNTNKVFKTVFERLDDIELAIEPGHNSKRKKIGF